MLIEVYEAEAISAAQTAKIMHQTQQLFWVLNLAWSEGSQLEGRHEHHVKCVGLAHCWISVMSALMMVLEES